MIAKSKTKEEHVEYLLKLFQRLRKYKLHLNPNKCTFGVRSGKLLGFIVNQQGIEVDLDKVRAAQEMPAPTTEKQMLLSEYDIEYHTQKAIKGSILDEHLAHWPIDDYQSIQFDFPDEDVMYLKAKDYDELLPSEGPDPESHWGLIFDGSVNAYGNEIGAVIVTPQGSHIIFTARLTFTCTNNVAEYEACIMDLEEAIDLRIKILDVYGDSTLIVDALATLSSVIVVNRWNDVPTINIMRLDRPTHLFVTEEVIDGKTWDDSVYIWGGYVPKNLFKHYNESGLRAVVAVGGGRKWAAKFVVPLSMSWLGLHNQSVRIGSFPDLVGTKYVTGSHWRHDKSLFSALVVKRLTF
ncbi:uncharacterized protein LOC127081058 [Lathyrus oleraceus]|uniref:uncharacterized protein LOC127081058 n=1 Tax=Pisum sativum TaxID=3888 RepID=UPI0021CFD796|nr:uncharacterized protein LOC127081058 [Pisum sativum]